MKTIPELSKELARHKWNSNAIPRKEFDELLDNIEYIISPETGVPVKPNTFSNIYYSYQTYRGVDRLGRSKLCDLFLNRLGSLPIKYKDHERWVRHNISGNYQYCELAV